MAPGLFPGGFVDGRLRVRLPEVVDPLWRVCALFIAAARNSTILPWWLTTRLAVLRGAVLCVHGAMGQLRCPSRSLPQDRVLGGPMLLEHAQRPCACDGVWLHMSAMYECRRAHTCVSVSVCACHSVAVLLWNLVLALSDLHASLYMQSS